MLRLTKRSPAREREMFLRSNLPGIGWGLLILFLCGLPGKEVPDPSYFDIFLFDKLVHIFLFLVLGFLLGVGFKKQYQYPLIKAHAKKSGFLIAAFYGLLIEILQYAVFIDRSLEAGDVMANMFGAGLGVLFFRGVYGKELA